MPTGSGWRRRSARRRLPDPIRYSHTDKPLEHWQRIVLNEDVDAHLKALAERRAAEISGDTHAGRNWKEYTSLMYPEFDICEPIAEPGRFEVVISNRR